jgi:hypothetical protein
VWTGAIVVFRCWEMWALKIELVEFVSTIRWKPLDSLGGKDDLVFSPWCLSE